MDETIKLFEELPEIKKLIEEGDAFYCNKGEWYLCKNVDDSAIELALDTALSVFKGQQQEIEKLKSKIVKLNTLINKEM